MDLTIYDDPAIPEYARVPAKLESIFMPEWRRGRDLFIHGNRRFVHYTSADAAISILKSKRFWLRNATCMVDFREVRHGFELMQSFFQEGSRAKSLIDAVDACFDGLGKEALTKFDASYQALSLETYIASVSTHPDAENENGRLSMWRAFGGTPTRVAMVFRVPAFSKGLNLLNVDITPVLYQRQQTLDSQFEEVSQRVAANREFLLSVGRPVVADWLFTMLVKCATCSKHDGFKEEQEWRIVYCPPLIPKPHLEREIVLVAGVPQPIYKLPLDGDVLEELSEIDMHRILERIIVGPTPFPHAVSQAFVSTFQECGYVDKQISCSLIPIRAG